MGPDGRRSQGHRARWSSRPPSGPQFQALLFSKIVPNCKKLGLLDAADGWLRTKFTELGVIEFESWVDTAEEYDAMASVPTEGPGRRLTRPSRSVDRWSRSGRTPGHGRRAGGPLGAGSLRFRDAFPDRRSPSRG